MIDAAEFAARRERAAAASAAHRIDALLISGLPNVRYLSGFTGSNALLLLAPERAILFTDPRYAIQAKRQSQCRVVVAKGSLYAEAAAACVRWGWRAIGFERGRLSYESFRDLEARRGPRMRFEPVAELVEALRMIKSPAEIELIRRSVNTNSRAWQKTLARIRPEWTENRAAAEIEYWMRRYGAEGPAFESIVAAGPNSALPHARPGAEPLGRDRLLLMDIGAVQEGYSSDMTRVVHLGPASAKAKKLYRAVLESQLAAIDAVRENASAASVDRAARSVLRKHGLDRHFVHSTGHGLGLEIHEPPRIGRKSATRLRAGMAITIEPGAYIEGFGGVRIEDTVVVTANGCEILTPSSKELLAI